MSAEFRHIFFSDGELAGIVAVYLKRTLGRLPSGSIIAPKLSKNPELTLSARLRPDKGGAERLVVLKGQDLKAATIAYCISQRIPLPAKGLKRIELFKNRLALIVALNVKGTGLDLF